MVIIYGAVFVVLIIFIIYGILLLTTFQSKKLPLRQQIELEDTISIGPWMLTPDNAPANWIGRKHQNKELREPINVILIDEYANSPEEATAFLLESCQQIGYLSRKIHSSGYKGEINNKIIKQLPREYNHAYSDNLYFLPNNHGRIFGPHYQNKQYYFTGAFSREGIDLLAEVKHSYVSFTVARDDFAARLNILNRYQLKGEVDLGNKINDESVLSTGDHDGKAVVLRRVQG